MGFNINTIKKRIQPLNPQIGINVTSIQSQIQQLNPQIGFKVYSIPFRDGFNH